MTDLKIQTISLDDYFEQIEERLDRIAAELLRLESGETTDSATAFREIGALKCFVTEVGLQDISHLCFLMEHFLEEKTILGDRERLDILLDACDFISVHRAALDCDSTLPEISESILRTLRGRSQEAYSDASGQIADSPLPDDPVSKRVRFLIVDDNLPNRELLRDILEPHGDCEIAVDGEDAINAFRTALKDGVPFDAVCLDIMMPGIDGHVTLEAIRCIEHGYKIYGSSGAKVIMTTAAKEDRHHVRAFKTGCQAYVHKPIDETRLIEELHRLRVLGAPSSVGATAFLDDVTEIKVMADAQHSQLAEVVRESLRNIDVLLEDVSHLRPDQLVNLVYRGGPMSAKVSTIDPKTEDGRHPVVFDWV